MLGGTNEFVASDGTAPPRTVVRGRRVSIILRDELFVPAAAAAAPPPSDAVPHNVATKLQ